MVCPRCGVSFRAALIRKIVLRTLALAVFVWLIGHSMFKKF
jgi:hypothetical protein